MNIVSQSVSFVTWSPVEGGIFDVKIRSNSIPTVFPVFIESKELSDEFENTTQIAKNVFGVAKAVHISYAKRVEIVNPELPFVVPFQRQSSEDFFGKVDFLKFEPFYQTHRAKEPMIVQLVSSCTRPQIVASCSHFQEALDVINWFEAAGVRILHPKIN